MKVKDKIVQTATKLFAKQGYNSTGINQIIEEADIAKGSFYYNFKSKEALCITFLEVRHDYWCSQLELFVNKKTSNQAPILAAFDFLKMMNEKESFRGCNFLNILSEISTDQTKVLKVIQEHKQDVRRYITSLVENEKWHDLIYLMFEGALIESQVFKDQWPITKAKQSIEALLKE